MTNGPTDIVPHGGLGELPAAVGPSDQQTQELNDSWNTYNEIEARLLANNIAPPTPPMVSVPVVTTDVLNGLNGVQYMETYLALDAWHNFIGETISQLENIILQINNEINDLDAVIRENCLVAAKQSGEPKPAEATIKHTVSMHPRRRFMVLEGQKNKQHLNRLQAKQKSLGRAEKLMSRNIERVKADMMSAGGYGGIQTRASGGLPPRIG